MAKWTDKEDSLLIEVVLEHIKKDSTQLNAFEEAAEKLGRTSSACGYRWNGVLREEHETAIKLAREKRSMPQGEITMDCVIAYLQSLRPEANMVEKEKKDRELAVLKEKYDALKKDMNQIRQAVFREL